jgi:hypothetical protein
MSVCGKAARPVLCGGRSAMVVPTATVDLLSRLAAMNSVETKGVPTQREAARITDSSSHQVSPLTSDCLDSRPQTPRLPLLFQIHYEHHFGGTGTCQVPGAGL